MSEEKKIHWKVKEKLIREGKMDAAGNWLVDPPITNGDPGDEDTNVRDSSTQKEQLNFKAENQTVEKKEQPLTAADVSRLVAQQMAQYIAAQTGDQAAQEELANAAEVTDPSDILPNPVFFFSNQRLWIKNYRDPKTGRERKLPYGGDGFQFRLIDSRLEGPTNDVQEYCIYSWHTKSKKELLHAKDHEWFDKLFWEDGGEAQMVTPNDIMWQQEAWKRLDKMVVEQVRAEVINCQAGGHNIRMLPNLHDTKKLLVPIFIDRIKSERATAQISDINKQESEVSPNEQLRRRAIAYERV